MITSFIICDFWSELDRDILKFFGGMGYVINSIDPEYVIVDIVKKEVYFDKGMVMKLVEDTMGTSIWEHGERRGICKTYTDFRLENGQKLVYFFPKDIAEIRMHLDFVPPKKNKFDFKDLKIDI